MSAGKFFIGIVIPGEAGARIELLKQELYQIYGFKGALRSPAHITLHRPFEYNINKKTKLVEKLSAFKTGPEFNIRMKGFAAFEPRVIYVNVIANNKLEKLHGDLKSFAKRELGIFNESDDLRGFHPHVTIASRDLKKRHFDQIWPLYKDRPFDAEILFNEISLLQLNKTWEVCHTIKLSI